MPGVLQTTGGNFVPGDDGSCPSAAALWEHVLRSYKGGVRMHIASASTAFNKEHTTDNLVVSDYLRGIVATKGRNIMLYLQAKLLASAGEELGEALEEEGEEEEEEDGDNN